MYVVSGKIRLPTVIPIHESKKIDEKQKHRNTLNNARQSESESDENH